MRPGSSVPGMGQGSLNRSAYDRSEQSGKSRRTLLENLMACIRKEQGENMTGLDSKRGMISYHHEFVTQKQ